MNHRLCSLSRTIALGTDLGRAEPAKPRDKIIKLQAMAPWRPPALRDIIEEHGRPWGESDAPQSRTERAMVIIPRTARRGSEADMVGLHADGQSGCGPAHGLKGFANCPSRDGLGRSCPCAIIATLEEVDFLPRSCVLATRSDACWPRGDIALFWSDSGWVRFLSPSLRCCIRMICGSLRVFAWAGNAARI